MPALVICSLAGSMWCFHAVFGPGPKPRQARDGHSWRMRPLFSLCPRASVLSSPPSVVCGRQGCGTGFDLAFPALSPRSGSRDAMGCVVGSRRPPLPHRGEGGGRRAAPRAPPDRRVCVLALASRVGAPGALRADVEKVHEAERRSSFPVPGATAPVCPCGVACLVGEPVPRQREGRRCVRSRGVEAVARVVRRRALVPSRGASPPSFSSTAGSERASARPTCERSRRAGPLGISALPSSPPGGERARPRGGCPGSAGLPCPRTLEVTRGAAPPFFLYRRPPHDVSVRLLPFDVTPRVRCPAVTRASGARRVPSRSQREGFSSDPRRACGARGGFRSPPASARPVSLCARSGRPASWRLSTRVGLGCPPLFPPRGLRPGVRRFPGVGGRTLALRLPRPAPPRTESGEDHAGTSRSSSSWRCRGAEPGSPSPGGAPRARAARLGGPRGGKPGFGGRRSPFVPPVPSPP